MGIMEFSWSGFIWVRDWVCEATPQEKSRQAARPTAENALLNDREVTGMLRQRMAYGKVPEAWRRYVVGRGFAAVRCPVRASCGGLMTFAGRGIGVG